MEPPLKTLPQPIGKVLICPQSGAEARVVHFGQGLDLHSVNVAWADRGCPGNIGQLGSSGSSTVRTSPAQAALVPSGMLYSVMPWVVVTPPSSARHSTNRMTARALSEVGSWVSSVEGLDTRRV